MLQTQSTSDLKSEFQLLFSGTGISISPLPWSVKKCYAFAQPELVGAFIQASSIDFAAAVITKSLQQITEAIQGIEG